MAPAPSCRLWKAPMSLGAPSHFFRFSGPTGGTSAPSGSHSGTPYTADERGSIASWGTRRWLLTWARALAPQAQEQGPGSDTPGRDPNAPLSVSVTLGRPWFSLNLGCLCGRSLHVQQGSPGLPATCFSWRWPRAAGAQDSPGRPPQSCCPANQVTCRGLLSASGPVSTGGPSVGSDGLTSFLLGLSRPSCQSPGSPLLSAASVPREKLCVPRACLYLPVAPETAACPGCVPGVTPPSPCRAGAGCRPETPFGYQVASWRLAGPCPLGWRGCGAQRLGLLEFQGMGFLLWEPLPHWSE